jgi:hypothetical protein
MWGGWDIRVVIVNVAVVSTLKIIKCFEHTGQTLFYLTAKKIVIYEL